MSCFFCDLEAELDVLVKDKNIVYHICRDCCPRLNENNSNIIEGRVGSLGKRAGEPDAISARKDE